jgi:NhaP-type Na+/H+ or K+/H+ antiporter
VTAEAFVATLAIVGLVIVVSTLLSGAIERAGVPHPAVFLLLGLVLGPSGMGVAAVPLDSPILRVVATLSLALVLFTDAVGLDLRDVRKHAGLALRVLGPGTMLSAGVMAGLAWWLLDVSWAAAALLGAALASTDPVLLRGFLKRPEVPESARVALRLESGLNDAVLLPVVIAAMAFMSGDEGPAFGRMALNVLVLGPAAGVAIGFVAVATLELLRKRAGIRRDYESLYSLGVCFTAFAAAEALHGSGFLAAFAAGLTIVALDVELCECFLEYGETTAEMALLFTFVLFGTGLLWTGFDVVTPRSLAFVGAVIVLRPLIYWPSLAGTGLSGRAKRLVSWFGPRGLSSLLLVLLPVFAGLPGAAQLFQLCALVVIASVVVHGGTLMWWSRLAGASSGTRGATTAAVPPAAAAPSAAAASVAEVSVAGANGPGTSAPGASGPAESEAAAVAPAAPVTITIDEVIARRAAGEPLVVADVRTARSARASEAQAAGAARIDPDRAVADATALDLPRQVPIALYCA